MHSTSSSENMPSAVTSLWPMPSRFLHVLVELVAAAQQAGDIGADLHVILARGLAVQHGVVAEHFVDLQRRSARGACATSSISSSVTEPNSSCAYISIGISAERLTGIARRAASEISLRVAAEMQFVHLAVHVSQNEIHAADAGDHIGDQAAFEQFRQRLQIAEDGARMCTRYGFGVPSLTM